MRAWQDTDLRDFAKLNQDPRVMKYLGPPLSLQQSKAIIARQTELTESGAPAFWAVERLSDTQFIGCIGVKTVNFDVSFAPCYEVGWRLSADYWGRGYATEGAKAALDIAFERWDMPRIYSFTVPKNTPSQRVMQRIGMKRVEGGDFDHPNLAEGDPLLRHVLYTLDREDVMS